jgi:hypothetical protein
MIPLTTRLCSHWSIPLRVQMKGVLPCLVPWVLHACLRDFYPASTALVCSYPIAQQPGQAVVQGRLSMNVCLRYRQVTTYKYGYM